MRAAANEILEAASVRHGWGTVCAVLESLTAAHAVHLELVPHGMFLKAHYKKEHKDKCARDGSVPPCSSACLSMGSPSATSSNGASLGCISRSSMLSMRCASSIEPKGSADHIRCANIFDAVDTDSSADASVGGDAAVEKLGRDIVVAPSPVEGDCMAVECEEAYPLQSAPGSEPILQLEPMQDGLMSRFLFFEDGVWHQVRPATGVAAHLQSTPTVKRYPRSSQEHKRQLLPKERADKATITMDRNVQLIHHILL